MNQNISIIIIFHNEETTLKKTLVSVLKQNYPRNKIQIILVNDRSSDSSVKSIKKFLKKKNVFLLETKSKPGISAARNIALKQATGEIIFFIDAHIYLKRDALSLINRKFIDHPEIDAVCGKYYSQSIQDYNQIRDLRRQINFKKNNKDKKINLEDFTTFSIALGAYRAEVFDDNFFPSGFNNSAGEDVYLQLKAHEKGHEFLFTPDLKAYHDAKINLKDLIKKTIYEIKSTANIITKSITELDELNVPFLNHFLDYPLFTFLFGISFTVFSIYEKKQSFLLGLMFVLSFLIRYYQTLKIFRVNTDYKIKYFLFIVFKDFIQFITLPLFLMKNTQGISQKIKAVKHLLLLKIKEFKRKLRALSNLINKLLLKFNYE